MEITNTVNDNVISSAELKAFSDDDYYLQKWQGLQQGRSKFAGFNLYAAVFGVLWCFYRKMYVLGSALLIAEFLLAVIIGISYAVIIGDHTLDLPTTRVTAVFGAKIITRVGLGFWANIAYFKKAVKVISKADSLNVSNDVYLNTIKSSGGINFLAPLVPVAIYLAMRILTQP